jgi:hypothetical protein
VDGGGSVDGVEGGELGGNGKAGSRVMGSGWGKTENAILLPDM